MHNLNSSSDSAITALIRIIHKYMVDFFGCLLPGLIGVIGFIIIWHSVPAYTQLFNLSEIKNYLEFTLTDTQKGFFILCASYTLGMLYYRRRLNLPDAVSQIVKASNEQYCITFLSLIPYSIVACFGSFRRYVDAYREHVQETCQTCQKCSFYNKEAEQNSCFDALDKGGETPMMCHVLQFRAKHEATSHTEEQREAEKYFYTTCNINKIRRDAAILLAHHLSINNNLKHPRREEVEKYIHGDENPIFNCDDFQTLRTKKVNLLHRLWLTYIHPGLTEKYRNTLQIVRKLSNNKGGFYKPFSNSLNIRGKIYVVSLVFLLFFFAGSYFQTSMAPLVFILVILATFFITISYFKLHTFEYVSKNTRWRDCPLKKIFQNKIRQDATGAANGESAEIPAEERCNGFFNQCSNLRKQISIYPYEDFFKVFLHDRNVYWLHNLEWGSTKRRFPKVGDRLASHRIIESMGLRIKLSSKIQEPSPSEKIEAHIRMSCTIWYITRILILICVFGVITQEFVFLHQEYSVPVGENMHKVIDKHIYSAWNHLTTSDPNTHPDKRVDGCVKVGFDQTKEENVRQANASDSSTPGRNQDAADSPNTGTRTERVIGQWLNIPWHGALSPDIYKPMIFALIFCVLNYLCATFIHYLRLLEVHYILEEIHILDRYSKDPSGFPYLDDYDKFGLQSNEKAAMQIIHRIKNIFSRIIPH